MRTYIIPPSLKDEKEKVIGGIFNMVEAAWMLLGAAIAVVVFLLLAKISKILGVFIGVLLGATVTIVFGFLKIKGYTVLKYIKYRKKFDKKQKLLPNKREYK